jgi:hypothetical protein
VTGSNGTTATTVTASGSPLTATFSSLLPTVTYTFTAYAYNSTGSSAVTAASPVTINPVGRIWNGTAFVPLTIARMWNGAKWVDLTTAKRWNGSAWVDLV